MIRNFPNVFVCTLSLSLSLFMNLCLDKVTTQKHQEFMKQHRTKNPIGKSDFVKILQVSIISKILKTLKAVVANKQLNAHIMVTHHCNQQMKTFVKITQIVNTKYIAAYVNARKKFFVFSLARRSILIRELHMPELHQIQFI